MPPPRFTVAIFLLLPVTMVPAADVPTYEQVTGHRLGERVTLHHEMKAYLEYVFSESRRFFEAGLDALEAAKKIDLGPYADWTEPERLVFNVERAYRELRGEPWDTPIDTVKVLRGMYELWRARNSEGRS